MFEYLIFTSRSPANWKFSIKLIISVRSIHVQWEINSKWLADIKTTTNYYINMLCVLCGYEYGFFFQCRATEQEVDQLRAAMRKRGSGPEYSDSQVNNIVTVPRSNARPRAIYAPIIVNCLNNGKYACLRFLWELLFCTETEGGHIFLIFSTYV